MDSFVGWREGEGLGGGWRTRFSCLPKHCHHQQVAEGGVASLASFPGGHRGEKCNEYQVHSDEKRTWSIYLTPLQEIQLAKMPSTSEVEYSFKTNGTSCMCTSRKLGILQW